MASKKRTLTKLSKATITALKAKAKGTTVRLPRVVPSKVTENRTPATKAPRRHQDATKTREDTPPAPVSSKRTTGQQAVKAGQAPKAILDAFGAWQGGAHISDLSSKTGVKRSKLRRLLIGLAGGKEAFKKMRADGAGGQVELFGGKRAQPGARIGIDDAKVPVIKHCKLSAGWQFRLERTANPGNIPIHTSPDGIEYVTAKSTERADLIVDHSKRGLSNTRLRKLETSPKIKAVKREAKLIAKGEAKHQAKRAAKRHARKMKRKGPRG